MNKKLTKSGINRAIKEYDQSCKGKPNFLELLTKLGILWDEWCEMSRYTNDECVRKLLLYNQHICGQMEKSIVYGKSNVPAVLMMLRISNPNRYAINPPSSAKQIDAKPIYEKLENNSGVDLNKYAS